MSGCPCKCAYCEKKRARMHEWYVRNRQNNPKWRETNKRRARAWRKKYLHYSREQQRLANLRRMAA